MRCPIKEQRDKEFRRIYVPSGGPENQQGFRTKWDHMLSRYLSLTWIIKVFSLRTYLHWRENRCNLQPYRPIWGLIKAWHRRPSVSTPLPVLRAAIDRLIRDRLRSCPARSHSVPSLYFDSVFFSLSCVVVSFFSFPV